mmetsp:Transcript_33669/g.24329  ORF Transcript_33669/g.24329 Transcript_33669/m.24329 type:complete len:168 (+) Transcript_33669:299-802(+)
MASKIEFEANISQIKNSIYLKGMHLANHSLIVNQNIRHLSESHFRENMTVLIHSLSSVVLDVLKHTLKRGIRIKVITTEAAPSNTGQHVAKFCQEIGVDCQVIFDSAVAATMPAVDCILFGCEAVLANGGIINKIGTLSVALIAQHFQKPCYVFCESFKFMKEFPLT